MKLSENFTLAEMLKSPTAFRLGLTEQFSPPTEVIENLRCLVENILQPLRESLGFPIVVSSGYRCPRLNANVGGAQNSQHKLGEAADIEGAPDSLNKIIFNHIINMRLDFDQLIYEFDNGQGGPDWIHVSYRKTGGRREVLIARKINGKTVYSPYVN